MTDCMVVNWTRMNTLLKPRTGKRFALISDYVMDTMLLIDLKLNYVVMSDSIQEKELNRKFIENAHGDVLSLGFGMGFILQPLMNKPEVNSITVIEIEPEIIELCASQLSLNDKVRVIVADALLWEPDMMFDTIIDDADYNPELIRKHEENHIHTDNQDRLRRWLKPNGTYLRWYDDGRYRS